MKETLSSDSLFHFTSKKEYLEGIIKNGFMPRLSLENYSFFDLHTKDEEIGVPMVCFCDIPLSKAKYHISIYGNYGIGCSKSWCIEQGISPVIYVNLASKTTLAIKKSLESLDKNKTEGKIDFFDYQLIGNGLFDLMRYTKTYEGDFFHGGAVYESKRFYDEREWRYVPEIKNPEDYNEHGLLPWLLRSNEYGHEYEPRRDEYHKRISKIDKFKIPLDPRKITYIIVEKDEDVNDIIKTLENKFEDALSSKEMRRLLARVLTKDQIELDF